MKAIERLSVIRHKSRNNKDWKHTDLFRILRKTDIWILAYENIKNNKGALTAGVTKETLDGISLERLMNLQDKVINESYQFKPVNTIMIPKPNGRKRPLGLPTANDKIVQEVIRLVLEAVYEPLFLEQSFGFRQGLGTHDALEYIEYKFRWVDWVIEGDIEGAYPTIDHTQLCNILNKQVQDTRFINLIRKLLNCGIMEQGQFKRSDLGIPQGSIVSPILANIYFNELDKWAKNKIDEIYIPRTNQRNKRYKQLSYQIGKIAKQMQELDKRSKAYQTLIKELKSRKKERAMVPSLATQQIQLEYVRYADDWMLGVKGDQKLATELKEEVTEFVSTCLKQTVHPTKTKLTDLRAGKAKFLGHEIYLPRNRTISPYIGSGTRTTRRTNPSLRFDIPLDSILKKMEERGYIQKLATSYRPISKSSYTTLEDIVIVKHFTQVWRGISNFYSGCTNLSKLQYIHYLLHMSCAMTLSHRHRSSVTKIFSKHGKTLTVSNGKYTTSFPYRNEWSLKKRKWQNKKEFVNPFRIYASRITRSKLGCMCRVCQSNNMIQMHHVKHVRKNGYRYLGFHKEMALLNRKQIPLCKECHKKVHDGLYDGIKLTKIKET